MPLPPNYDPACYKSKDMFERLGLTRDRSLNESLVDSHWRAIMEHWAGMRIVPGKEKEVTEAQEAISEARDILRVPGNGAKLPDPDAASVNVLLIGGKGAGKSAVVGALYDCCQKAGSIQPLSARLSVDTRSNVVENLRALKTFCNPMAAANGNKTFLRRANGGGNGLSYNLLVSLAGRDRVQLRFIDTAGEDLVDVLKSPEPDDAYLAREIARCQAAMLVVDTPALFHQPQLEQNGLNEDDRRNLPEHVRALLEQWVRTDPEAKRILCIVPVKTESYLYDAGGKPRPGAVQDIVRQTTKEFEDSIEFLRQHGRCAIVVTPVETCGCLSLEPGWPEEIKAGAPYPQERWDRVPDVLARPHPKRYSPESCELPLIYLLNFFLSLMEEKEGPTIEETLNNFKVPPDKKNPLVNLIEQFLGPKVLRGWNDLLDQLAPTVSVFFGLFGTTFAKKDCREAIRELMRRGVRPDLVHMTGDLSLLTLF